MNYDIRTNPFFEIFGSRYEEIMAKNRSSFVGDCITGLLTIDEEEIANIMTNELGNTLMIYTSKIQKDSIQAITLKIDAPADTHFIPSILLASAYDSYTITHSTTTPLNKMLPVLFVPMYNKVTFGNTLFSEYGGCDVDMISDFLFDVVSMCDEIDKELFTQIQSLAIIKILEVLYNACSMLIKGDRFKKLPKKLPFTFFAHLDDSEYLSICTVKE